MPKGPSLRLGLSPFIRHPSISVGRILHTSSACSTAVTIPLYDTLAASALSNNTRRAPASQDDPRELLKTRLFGQLDILLSRSKSKPARIWSQYIELLHYIGAKDIPLETHQSVLRNCVPPAAQLRVSFAQYLRDGHYPKSPHLYENRLQTVIHNIKATGVQPTLEDYHVVLKQFAAVGHHIGAARVYEELVASDVRPQPKTYGLILQSLAHRLALACPVSRRAQLVQQITRICRDTLVEMGVHGVQLSPANLDLSVRILKETADEQGFSHLMRVGYGIDLDNPDRPPVENFDHQDNKGLPTPLPFSTAALNTTIDMLGHFRDVSKLVQAFEVLTEPLPPLADQHFSQSFDDDDDYGAISPPSPQSFRTPHAAPNTTTYNLLLRHLSRAGHGALARHYLQQAYCFDRTSDRATRSKMVNLPADVLAPHFAINRGTILPVFGLANRDKDIELMRWVEYIVRHTVRRKKNDVLYYTAIAAQLARQPLPPHSQTGQTSATPVSSSDDIAQTAEIDPKGRHQVDPSAATFEVGPDASLVFVAPPAKIFDINLHLQILHRDIERLEDFNKGVSDVISRTTQRVKERLGRRVWARKDIYLFHENKRKHISRQTWSNIVRFKQPSGEPEHRNRVIQPRMSERQDLPHMRPNFVQGRRRLSSAACLS